VIVTRAPDKGVVSIVVAGRDCERSLAMTLKSAVDQSYAATEIVYVDHGSLDGTRPLAGRFAPRVRCLLASPESGLEAARNAGVRETNGQFVAFLHPGDLWSSDKIARQVDLMELHPDLGLVFTRSKMLEGASEPGEIAPPGRAWEEAFDHGVAVGDTAATYAKLVLSNFVAYSSILARRVALPLDGPFRTHLRRAADYDMVLRASELKRFAYIDEPLTILASRVKVAAPESERALEELALLADNLARNAWLMRKDPEGMRRREADLLQEAGRRLLAEGRRQEARPLLRKAWRMSPLDVKLAATLLASLTAPPRTALRPKRTAES
jgi:glycosyltransferase involved in cell wall biosynthesis